jgi:putative phosphoesterase
VKKILLVSDTHGFLDPALMKHVAEADEIWHAGDIGPVEIADQLSSIKKLRAVYGNIDNNELRRLIPETLIFNCEELKVFMTHIGGYPGRYPLKLKEQLAQEKPGLFICGHSHILKVIYDEELGLLHINPGAAGRQGIHQHRTAVRFSVEGEEIKDLAIIELGRRGMRLSARSGDNE